MHQNASKKEKGTEKSKIYEKGEKSRQGRNKGAKRFKGSKHWHVRYTRGDLPLHPPIRRIFSFNLNK
jgi:hypothetical protein